MQKPQTPLKKYVMVVGMLWLVICPFIWISLHYTQFTGDLTRIGQWREQDFGWTQAQEHIPTNSLTSSPIHEADILVVGDSFSDPLIWQSILVDNGFNVSTISWSQIGDICADFSEHLKKSGFKGKYIIIESVERLVTKQFKRSVTCEENHLWPDMSKSRVPRPLPSLPDLSEQVNLDSQFWIGIKTIYHSYAIRNWQQYPSLHNWKSKSTHIYQLQDGCEYFTHHLCNWGLFFYEDFRNPELSHDDFQNLKLLHQRLKGYQVIWLIIPNKSSVYQRKVSQSFWSLVAEENLGPNLYSIFNEKKKQIKDLYSPNDTHLSVQGYKELGQQVNQFIKK